MESVTVLSLFKQNMFFVQLESEMCISTVHMYFNKKNCTDWCQTITNLRHEHLQAQLLESAFVKGLCTISLYLDALKWWYPKSKRSTPIVARGIHLYWSSTRTCETHMYCRAFGCEAVTTCFDNWSLSRLGFEQTTFRLRANALDNPVRHCHAYIWNIRIHININISCVGF